MVSQFTGDRSENTGTNRVFIIFDNYGCVLVKFDIGTVSTSDTTFGADDNGLNYLTLTDCAAGSSFSDGANDYIADIGEFTPRAA